MDCTFLSYLFSKKNKTLLFLNNWVTCYLAAVKCVSVVLYLCGCVSLCVQIPRCLSLWGFEALPHPRTNIPARPNCSQGAAGDFTLNPERQCWQFQTRTQGHWALASYTSVSPPASATQTPPEELFRGYFKGKFVPSFPRGNPDTTVRPEYTGHRVAPSHAAQVPGVGLFP